MFIRRSILLLLQTNFSDSKLGQERADWFVQTLLAVIVPLTSSMTANLLRTVQNLFGLDVTQRRFYTFMASPKLPWQQLWHCLWGMIPAPLTDGRSTINAFSQVVMLKTLKCPVRVVRVFRRSQWVALFTTDMTLSVEQIIEFYAARWKIEAAFKELKQEIGSRCSQTRNIFAVKNHLQFCMMAMTLTWIYAAKIDSNPIRRHQINGRASFAFSDIRRNLSKVILSDDFLKGLLKSRNPMQNTIASLLLRLVA